MKLGALTWAAGLCVVMALAVMGIRLHSAISLSEPLHTLTGGAEEESFLALWKYATSGVLYADPHRIPFAGTYYNWLFYVFYGEAIKLALGPLGLAPSWLPTIGRLVTLAGAALGAGMCFLMFAKAAGAQAARLRPLLGLLAVFTMFGPLLGFWMMSVHPEVWATTCDIAATLAMLVLYDRRPRAAVGVASLLSYAAWSFKHLHIFLAAGLGLFLLLRRDWRGLILLIVLHGAGWGLALLVGGPLYAKMLFLVNTDVTFAAWQFLRNLLNVASKTTPLLCGLIVFAGLALSRPSLRRRLWETPALFAVCGLLASAALGMGASAKVGASESYYFTLTVFAALTTAIALSWLVEEGGSRGWSLTLLAGWGVNAIAVGSVLAGVNGVTDVRPWHRRAIAAQACLAPLPRPLLAPSDPYFSMPWIEGDATPHFVLAYNYSADRAKGLAFEGGGVGGLLQAGYFGTVALPRGTAPAFDGAPLDRYRVAAEDCGGLTLYVRKDVP